jgi:hypothetical protein
MNYFKNLYQVTNNDLTSFLFYNRFVLDSSVLMASNSLFRLDITSGKSVNFQSHYLKYKSLENYLSTGNSWPLELNLGTKISVT